MSWRDVAQAAVEAERCGDNRDDRVNSPVSAPNAPIVPIVPANPDRSFREWRAGFRSLDPTAPVHELSPGRWRQMLDDAEWLLEHYAIQAARDGWSAADLFGLWPEKDGWGGIADRLQSSRSLVMSADRAGWRVGSVTMSFNRGSYPELRLPWEA